MHVVFQFSLVLSFCTLSNTPFTRSSKHQAKIKHSLHEAIIKQTSSKHRANVKRTPSTHQAIRAHVVHVYIEYVCLMFAWSCKRGIKERSTCLCFTPWLSSCVTRHISGWTLGTM